MEAFREKENCVIYIAALEEARSCANAEGIGLDEADVQYWIRVIDGLNSEGEPSMRQDVKAGRRTEVALFAETVCDLGRKHGIETPWNDKFLRKLEAGNRGNRGNKRNRG